MKPNFMSLCLRNTVIEFHCVKHIQELYQMTEIFPFSIQIYQYLVGIWYVYRRWITPVFFFMSLTAQTIKPKWLVKYPWPN